MDLMDKIDQSAREWIRQAGENIKHSFKKALNIETKSDRNDLVTNMDKEVEQFFIHNIRENFPTHQILGEEGYGDPLQALDGIVWIIDPIDGTMNFVHQQRNFTISVAIYENGVGKLGYVYDVVHDELYFAKKGEGAFVNGEKLGRLRNVKLEESVIALNATWLVENKRMNHEVLAPLVQTVRGIRSYGSAALEMVYVATGRLDAYISPRLAAWDYAAGKIIVEEVGGVVSNFEGKEVSILEKGSVLVSNKTIYDELFNQYIVNAVKKTDR